ncbi:MAG: hypothetical protein IPK10_16845 [Bacteroidetes bacterium]|nr:hypothetical protein [Bacteroidota bacterium]
MVKAVHDLDELYRHCSTHLDRTQKLKLKYRKIASIMKGIDQLQLFHPERYRFNFKEETLPNNTFFMSFFRYRKQLNEFDATPILTAKDLAQFICHQKENATY